MPEETDPQVPQTRDKGRQARQERLAKALRKNVKRRRQQTQSREESAAKPHKEQT